LTLNPSPGWAFGRDDDSLLSIKGSGRPKLSSVTDLGLDVAVQQAGTLRGFLLTELHFKKETIDEIRRLKSFLLAGFSSLNRDSGGSMQPSVNIVKIK